MIAAVLRLCAGLALAAALLAPPQRALAQDAQPEIGVDLPDLSKYAAPNTDTPLSQELGEVMLKAQLTDDGPEITRGARASCSTPAG